MTSLIRIFPSEIVCSIYNIYIYIGGIPLGGGGV